MTAPTYTDRRSAGAEELAITLEADRISVSGNGTLRRAIGYADISEIRLSIGLAGRDSQIVCRVTAGDGTRIEFGSRSWTGIGEWDNRADRFRDFNAALHSRLLHRRDSIRFVEGQPLWSGLLLPLIGLLIAVMGAGFTAYFGAAGNPLALVGLPGIAVGLYLAWMLRPRAAKTYDPAIYAAPDQ